MLRPDTTGQPSIHFHVFPTISTSEADLVSSQPPRTFYHDNLSTCGANRLRWQRLLFSRRRRRHKSQIAMRLGILHLQGRTRCASRGVVALFCPLTHSPAFSREKRKSPPPGDFSLSTPFVMPHGTCSEVSPGNTLGHPKPNE